MATSYTEIEQFSMDVATLIRIDKILQDLNECNRIGDILGSRYNLKLLYIETQPHCTAEEKTEIYDDYRDLLKISMGETPDNELYIQEDGIDFFLTFEMKLRNLLNSHGILMKKQANWLKKIRE